MTHERYEENVGPYMLGALPDLERQAFERHIDRCDQCRSAVERLRPAADALPLAATPLTPPPRLKAALMEVVECEARTRDREASDRASAPRPTRAPRRHVTELLSPRSRLRPAVAWAGAALVLVAGGAGGFALGEGGGDEAAQRLTAQVDQRRLPDASAQLVVAEGGSTAVLRANAMPSLDEGSVYQVWLQREGETVPQSLFQVDPDGRGAGVVTDGVAGADAVMVTREPAGGSDAPTETPVLTVEL